MRYPRCRLHHNLARFTRCHDRTDTGSNKYPDSYRYRNTTTHYDGNTSTFPTRSHPSAANNF